MPISGPEKAAFLMHLIGHERAAQLFKSLSKREQVSLMRAMLSSKSLSDAEVAQICSDFVELCAKNSLNGADSLRVPVRAYAGIELPRVSRVNDICDEIPDWVLVEHLKNQLDSVVSAVLGSIDGQRAGVIFKAMPEKRQPALLMSLSQERVLDADVLDDLETDLEELRVRTASGRFGQRVGGPQRVTSLVQALDQDTRQKLLEEMSAFEPQLARQIEGGLLSVARLAELLPTHLALLLTQIKDADIGSFLRGESAQVQAVYLSALSRSRREEVECLIAPEKKITQKQKSEACERLRFCAQRMKGEGRIIFPWEESLVG